MKASASDNNQYINASRFPLIVLVLFQHSVVGDSSPMRWSLDGNNVYHFITELISHHICSIAVPCFFVFSGFLFFHNAGTAIDSTWVKNKWKRRVKTLLIPYLLWNLFNIAAILSVTAVFHGLGIPITSNQMTVVEKGPLFWFITGPVNFPLWYLRDLVVLSLLAPFLYYPVKNAPRFSLFLLALVYSASAIWNFYPSLPFFGIGCWVALRKQDLLHFCRTTKHLALILSCVFLVLATGYWGQEVHPYLWLVFAPFGMITFMNFNAALMENIRTKNLLLKHSETVFFIYAAHEIYILGWSKGLLLRIFGHGLAGHWICYFTAPVLTLLLCLALFYLLKKLAPKLLVFSCGGRISPSPAIK